jgi:hypothetical protein
VTKIRNYKVIITDTETGNVVFETELDTTKPASLIRAVSATLDEFCPED